MLTSRKVAFSSFVLVAFVLGGCDRLKDLLQKKGDGDGGVDAAAEADASPPVVVADEVVDASDAVPTTTTVTPVPAVARKIDGGATDAGVVLVTDAGAVVVVDAGAAQACCCEATGFPLQSVAMSECNKTRKGQCVKKERCAAVVDAGSAAPIAPTTPAPPVVTDNCCCAVSGKNRIMKQKDCGAAKGACVAMSTCLTIRM